MPTTSVTLLVGPDCLGPGLAALLADAAGRLDVAVHEIGPSYAWMLARAAGRGLPVRLLVDDHAGPTTGTVAVLRRSAASVEVRACGGRRGADAHWKLILAGDAGSAVVAVGTGNLILRDAQYHGDQPAGTRELWVLLSGHPAVEAVVRGALDSAWATARAVLPAPAAPAVPDLTVPPVHDPGSHSRPLTLDVAAGAVTAVTCGGDVARLLQQRLDGCRERALVCVPYIHPGAPAVAQLLDAFGAAGRRGAAVRVLLGADPRGDPSAADVTALVARGLPARVMDAQRVTTGHAKVAVIDSTLICGSANWSGAGLGGNLEAALAVDDARAADHVAAVFEHDWARSGPSLR